MKKSRGICLEEIFRAIEMGDFTIVRALLEGEKGILHDRDRYWSMTPLHYASYKNMPSIARLLLEQGAGSELLDMFGYTPLHWASRMGHRDVAVTLIRGGADLNSRICGDERKMTPLHLACREGHLDVAEVLIDNGADLSLKSEERPYNFKEFMKAFPDYKWEKTALDYCGTEECRRLFRVKSGAVDRR